MQWRFDDGKEPGPRAPTYPGFSETNKARLFDVKTPIKVTDSPELRFGLNETITLEAWVKVADASGTPYIIGKGRLGTGVLRSRLFDWIADPDLRPFIAGYASAHPKHGGSGAVYLFLRSKR